MRLEESPHFTCPMSMVGPKAAPCRGKDCAAWRWAEPKFGALEKRRGYCGLAGEPKYPVSPGNEMSGIGQK